MYITSHSHLRYGGNCEKMHWNSSCVKEATTLFDRQRTYGEQQGFLDANIFVEGLKNVGPGLTQENF
jgi:hypothetical protein